jgi:lipopolysaccharide export system protein LptC
MDQPTAVTAIDHRDARSYQSSGRGDGARAFRAAVRHSRRVRILRVAIPFIAAIVLAAAVFVTWFNPLRLLLHLPKEVGRMVVTGTKITMEQPRLAGYTRDSRSYELTARAASQDILKPDLVELKEIHAVVQLQDRGLMEMTAPTGVYNSKTEALDLSNNIVMVASSGFECRLSEAKVDIRNGHIVSEKPVDVKFASGTINSNRLEVTDSGALIRFGGGVIMNVVLENATQQAGGSAVAQ